MAFETGQATIAETEKLTEARAAIEEALASSSAPCLTCSFQAEDMAVLALIREKAPDIPVLFLETGYHFAETYQYRDEMTARYGLNLVNVIPKQTVAEQESQFGILNRTAPDRCCKLRKVEPLFSSLEGYDTWFTGPAARAIAHARESCGPRSVSAAHGQEDSQSESARLVD